MSEICYSDQAPCKMCNDTQAIEVLPDGCNNGNDTMLDECPWCLRRKLNQAEASLAERGRMLETTHRVQRSYRAAVAAALAELRAHWNAQYQHYVSKTDDSSWERRQELLDRMRELDAVIAKLNLAELDRQA